MIGFQANVPSHQPAGTPSTTAPPAAAQACATCRKQKRRCDKLLPACSRCASLQRACDYAPDANAGASSSAAATAPTAEDFAALQKKLAEIEARLLGGGGDGNSSNSNPVASSADAGSSAEPGPGDGPGWGGAPVVTKRFPSVFFLDMDIYKFAGIVPPKPVLDIPMEVIDILDSSEVIEEVASAYFNSIHKWFSFISRKRMNLGLSLAQGGPDLALLFLAMKLITTTPPPVLVCAADLPLYRTTKQFLAQLEAAGTASLIYLQAMILIALYEFGHAVYPAAWMSVGNCVRYAAMLGLPSYGEAVSVLGNCTTWTEAEERHRVYWATHILDRAISLGSKRPFAGGPDPPPPEAAFLPICDLAWDAGDVGARALPLPVGGDSTPRDHHSQPQPGAAAGLARLAQASLLVTKGMAHCRGRSAVQQRRQEGRGRGGGSEEEEGEDDDVDMVAPGPYDGGGHTPRSTREVTALVTEMSGFCSAVGEDMAGAGTGADAYWALVPALCLSWSTAVMVLDMYSCPEHMRPPGAGSGAAQGRRRTAEEEMTLQIEAINGLKAAAARVREIAVGMLEALDEGGGGGVGAVDGFMWTELSVGGRVISLGGRQGEMSAVDKFSPLCLDTLYCAMSTFEWLWKENGDPEMKEGVDLTKRCLERVGKRWRLAREYLEVGELHNAEAMLAMSSNGAQY